MINNRLNTRPRSFFGLKSRYEIRVHESNDDMAFPLPPSCQRHSEFQGRIFRTNPYVCSRGHIILDKYLLLTDMKAPKDALV